MPYTFLGRWGNPDTDILDGRRYSNFVDICVLWDQRRKCIAPEPLMEKQTERIPEAQFKEEELEGRMKPLSEKEARKKYPGSVLRIAAQGILEKPDFIGSSARGTPQQRNSCVEDRLENPGPRESFHALWRRPWQLVSVSSFR
eukprot:s427_g1.t1